MKGGLLFNEIYGLHIVCAIQLYFIHPMETKKPLKSQPSKYGKNVN